MSIFSSIGSALKGAATGFLTGGIPGAAIGAGISVLGSGAKTTLPKVGAGMMVSKPLPTLPGGGGGGFVGGTVGGALAGAARSIGAAAKGAATMCAKYPQWCLAVGGVSAIAAMMKSGQLPMPKRRRRRGITPRDLQSFRRVATLIKSYGPTARKVPSSCAPRKSCKTR